MAKRTTNDGLPREYEYAPKAPKHDLDAALRDILGMLNAPDVYTRECVAQTIQALLDYRSRASALTSNGETT